jgi:hypothetical protein
MRRLVFTVLTALAIAYTVIEHRTRPAVHGRCPHCPHRKHTMTDTHKIPPS